MRFLEDRILAGLLVASEAKRCSSLSWVRTEKATSWHDRLKTPEKLEKVTSLIFEDNASGAIIGTLTQWAAHPTLLHAANNSISSDYPGTFRHFLAQDIPGVHIYVNGMLGASYIPIDEAA